MGTAVAQWLRCCATNQKVAGSIPAGVSGYFIDINSFRSNYGPGVDSASNRNEYQEFFLGVKSGRCVRLTTYHHPVPLSRNLGTLTSWNPLGLSRPVMGLLYLYIYTYTYTHTQTSGANLFCASRNSIRTHSVPVLRQVHSLLQSEFIRKCDLGLPFSVSSTLCFP